MARVATWRDGELAWACGNPNWRRPESYGLTPETPLQGWAWEFLRRNVLYRESVDSGDTKSAEKWGLLALVDYRQAFERFDDTSRPKWLALQSFELLSGPRRLTSLAEGQFALIFDLRRVLRKEVLQRQLAEFVERLYQDDPTGWGEPAPERRHGGRPYSFPSLLTYLRFADAVAQDRDIDSGALQVALGLTSARARKQLHEAHLNASSLVGKKYSRLVDLELSPLRRIPAPLRQKPAPAKRPALAVPSAEW